MISGKINLLDFGTNDKGEYVNLVEEEKIKADISQKEFQEWLNKNEKPLIKIAYDVCVGWHDLEKTTCNEIKGKLLRIVSTRTYHYGNMEKGLYVYSMHDNKCFFLVFENEKHIMANINYAYGEDTFNKYLNGSMEIQCNALSVHCYDLKGNKINEYGNGDKDIRQRVVINEWQMDKFGTNRMEDNKKIKNFYEVEFTLPDLINYFGEDKN